ncbi:MAG TPA: class I SAM-dependent RNA methyltransferase [Blastocatellia bacterium]
MSSESLKVGDIIEVTTERLAYGGDAIARSGGLAVFIPLAAPGERLRVRVVERKKNFARAVIEQVLVASTARREPACHHFSVCGGCQLQHMTYEAQLEAKAGFVRDALARIGHIDWPHEIKVRHASEFGYRARAQVKLARLAAGENNDISIGFNRAGSHSVCDVISCPILAPELNDALLSLRSSLSNKSLDEVPEVEMALGEAGVSVEPRLPGLSSEAVQRNARGASYRFSPATFFQVNRLLLDDLIEEAIDEHAGRLAIDLYAGVGLFTIQLAARFDRVIGVESDREATRFARENILANRVPNVQFFNARVEQWLDTFTKQQRGNPPPGLLLLDPPRSGAAEAVSHIAALRPASISYVSCDPVTLARDLRRLIDSGYDLQRVTAVDLFPQTYHVETVAWMVKR